MSVAAGAYQDIFLWLATVENADEGYHQPQPPRKRMRLGREHRRKHTDSYQLLSPSISPSSSAAPLHTPRFRSTPSTSISHSFVRHPEAMEQPTTNKLGKRSREEEEGNEVGEAGQAAPIGGMGQNDEDNEAGRGAGWQGSWWPDEQLDAITPRAKGQNIASLRSPADQRSRAGTPTRLSKRSTTSTSTSVSSARSYSVPHKSSPPKQMRHAELENTGFSHRKFGASRVDLPPSLKRLHSDLDNIANGVGILPSRCKDEIPDRFNIPSYAFCTADDAKNESWEEGWRFPTAQFVTDVMNQAAECELHREGECSWNMDVHRDLLARVYRPFGRAGLVDFKCCTSAQIIPEYRPDRAPSKMVDFCIIIRPDRATTATAASTTTATQGRGRMTPAPGSVSMSGSQPQTIINHLCRSRPAHSINHTDWGSLCQHPIALSIETKRPGEELERATLQMGTWHAAQWRSLLHGQRVAGSPPPSLEQGRPDVDNDGSANDNSLSFLPGIIIHGHEWAFVATTREGGKAVLHTRLVFGTTESEFGTYKILAALRHLGHWCEQVYWPGFMRDVCGVKGANSPVDGVS